MNYKKLIFIFAIAIFFITCKDPCKRVTCPVGETCIDGKCHCTDSSSCPTGQVCVDGQCVCVAGNGGQVTLVCSPQHHTKPIYNYAKPGYPDSVFLKFSPAIDFVPSANPANYDLVLTGNSGDDFINVPDMKCGNYFIFMTGWDSLINYRVTGGIPYSFSQTSGEIDLDVPVTE